MDTSKDELKGRIEQHIQRQPIPVDPAPVPEQRLLDISKPEKWRLGIEQHIQQIPGNELDAWLQEFRIIYNVVMRLGRDRTNRILTGNCFVCERTFQDGRPAGEAGYYDGDRNYIRVWCCHPNEYPQLLQKVKAKEDQVRTVEELATIAVRQAMINVRQPKIRP